MFISVLKRCDDHPSLGGFINENNSSMVDCATWRTRSVLSMPTTLAPLHLRFDLVAKVVNAMRRQRRYALAIPGASKSAHAQSRSPVRPPG
jgi:hypothetical protein